MKCLTCFKETDQLIDGDPLCSEECCHTYSGVTCDDGHCVVADCPVKAKASPWPKDEHGEDEILDF